MRMNESIYTLVVTGASGVGKTAAVAALDARSSTGVRCFHFDTIGVPPADAMARDFGSAEGWQAFATAQWLDQLDRLGDDVLVAVLDAQTRPSFVIAATRHEPRRRGVRMVLLDCDRAERERRLRILRRQPALVNDEMTAWAAYLRGQADALQLPVIDTSSSGVEKVADRLYELIGTLLASAQQSP
jgi:hypothetical protein